MAALIDATTGYDTVADFSDTGAPDSLDSSASLEVPSSYASFLWPSYAMIEGRFLRESSESARETWGVME